MCWRDYSFHGRSSSVQNGTLAHARSHGDTEANSPNWEWKNKRRLPAHRVTLFRRFARSPETLLSFDQLFHVSFVGDHQGRTTNLKQSLALEMRKQPRHCSPGCADYFSNFLVGQRQRSSKVAVVLPRLRWQIEQEARQFLS